MGSPAVSPEETLRSTCGDAASDGEGDLQTWKGVKWSPVYNIAVTPGPGPLASKERKRFKIRETGREPGGLTST